MLHHNKDNTAYHAPQTMGSDGPGREVEGGDGRVRWTHDDQHNGEGAMRTHSLYLSLSLSLSLSVVHHSLPCRIKGRGWAPMLRDRESSRQSDTTLIRPQEHTSTLSPLGKRQAELWPVLVSNCPNQMRATNMLLSHLF